MFDGAYFPVKNLLSNATGLLFRFAHQWNIFGSSFYSLFLTCFHSHLLVCMCFDFFLLNALCAHKDRRSEEWLQKSRKKRTTYNTSDRNECFQNGVDMLLEIYLDSWDHKLNENFYLLYLCIISFLLLSWVTQAIFVSRLLSNTYHDNP